MLADSWRLASTLTWSDTSKNATAIASAVQFQARLIRTDAFSAGVPSRWRRSGYLRIVSRVGVGGDELANFVVPLNARKIFPIPRVTGFYQIEFRPVDYLASGLRLRLWAYTGPEPDADLLRELGFLH